MRNLRDPARVEAIAPCFKRRLSGVTATAFRVVPVQARGIEVALAGPALPPGLPQIRLRDLLLMPRRGAGGPRVWHARRNVEMLAGLALRALGKDLRLVFTSASQRRASRYKLGLIRRMDAVVATSARAAERLERPPDAIVGHGVDAGAFAPGDRAALRRALGLPEGLLLGCYGRIRPSKGTDLFVSALLRCLPRHPGAAAVVMGGVTPQHRAFADRLASAARRAGLGDRVLFRPEAELDAMPAWYGALDLYVCPSLTEGFGMTPLEAMACGVPVVATRVGAFEEQVAEGRTGLLVPPGDLGALAAAMEEALADPARLRSWGEAGRAHVLARFRLEDEAAALNALYRRMLA